MADLPEIPAETKLSPYVTRILGFNPSGFTLQGTNTYLVGHPRSKERLLIDTGSGFEEYTSHLASYLRRHKLQLAAIAITHWHPDHYGGLEEVRRIAPNARFYKYILEDGNSVINTGDVPFQHWGDEQVIEEGGVHLKAYHTPGHCDDHISIWLEEEQTLFSGDNLLGHGSSVFKDYITYMDSLSRMRDLPKLGIVYPGHGVLIKDGVLAFNRNIEHRHQREQELLQELKASDRPLTDEELVLRAYKEIATRSRQIQIGALSNTQHYLAKLLHDGKVTFDGHKWSPANRDHYIQPTE